MAQKPSKEDAARELFKEHLQSGETLQHFAYGVKQPHIGLIVLLLLLGILPGLIAIAVMTKHYHVGLTDKRLLILRTGGMKPQNVKEVLEYPRSALPDHEVKTSTGAIFTNMKVIGRESTWVAKFHRAYSKTNREESIAISEAIAPA